ncbi:MAG: hypothetical protein JHC93_02180 [Parachlamydiales bacterium]|nr:hypothetical protein [Parachlamydiales bacterium]
MFAFCVLALCGILVVFCRGLAIDAGSWISLSLTFLPIFLCSALLLSTGIVLIRIYHDDVKRRKKTIAKVISESWDLMIGTSYLCVPIILCYLMLWIIQGVFLLLKEIPAAGNVISIIFSFGPFLLILGSILLCILVLVILFSVTPLVALRSVSRMKLLQYIIKKWQGNPFTNSLLLFLSLTPAIIVTGILILAAWMTDINYLQTEGALYTVMQWFFMMLPFVAVLSPTVVFFFNFSAESHVLMQKRNNNNI